MRSSGCSIQQALTPEAANMVKQAVSIARRRGHAQVTPLHVAHTMLSSPSGLFRAACLQSHAHPLQCRALELCFNVALNRLPTSTSSPMLGPHYHHHQQTPTISNALVAAFKRAQAHQRRGSIDTQHQPLLALKIELEQLIISILDDPSVSRVMREAGFSSTLVKDKVEQAVSESDEVKTKEPTATVKQVGWSDEDVTSVIQGMLNSKRKRCCVVVGESLPNLEAAVRGVMDRVQKGDVPDGLRDARFEPLSLQTFLHLSRDQLLQKMAHITSIVRTSAPKGLVFYLADLKWAAEFMRDQRRTYYCPIEHAILELKRLLQDYNDGQLWLLGVATLQTYTSCGRGHPSLDAVWGIHPIMIPAGSLGLSLIPESDSHSKKVESERTTPQLQSLPSWLQKCKDDASNDAHQELFLAKDLSKRSWSFSERTLNFSVVSPPSYDEQRVGNRNGIFKMYIPEASSTSSSDMMEVECREKRFKEYNPENLERLCNGLEKKVPWQRSIIRDIASTVLNCRSRRVRRKGDDHNFVKEETWLFFLGPDSTGKEKIAKELAMLVFGSHTKYSSIALSRFSATEDSRNKRVRDEQRSSCMEKLAEAISSDPGRVFFVEDVDQVDHVSQVGMGRAIERGKIRSCDGDVSLGDSIIILSCERFRSRSRACSPCSEDSTSISLDLNMSINEEEDESSGDQLGLLAAVDKCILFREESSCLSLPT